MTDFFSLYRHDFLRIASCVPRMRVGDPRANLAETLELAAQGAEAHAGLAAMRRGVMTNLLNPKALMFCALLLPQFVSTQHDISAQYLILGSTLVGIGTVVLATTTVSHSRCATMRSYRARARSALGARRRAQSGDRRDQLRPGRRLVEVAVRPRPQHVEQRERVRER